jgi:hypothetical protein
MKLPSKATLTHLAAAALGAASVIFANNPKVAPLISALANLFGFGQ